MGDENKMKRSGTCRFQRPMNDGMSKHAASAARYVLYSLCRRVVGDVDVDECW